MFPEKRLPWKKLLTQKWWKFYVTTKQNNGHHSWIHFTLGLRFFKRWSTTTFHKNLLHLNLWFHIEVPAKSAATEYGLNHILSTKQNGCYKFGSKRCEVCKYIKETDYCPRIVTGETFKINRHFDFNGKCLICFLTWSNNRPLS